MARYVRVTYINETSGHDGYCSGEECEYKKGYAMKTFTVPDHYKQHPLGLVTNWKESDWITLLDEPDTGCGSGFCKLSDECKEHGLHNHDYRHTILCLEIIEGPQDMLGSSEDIVEKSGISASEDTNPIVFLRVPNITSFQRDKLKNNLDPGVIFFNTSTGKLNVYDGTEWKVVQ